MTNGDRIRSMTDEELAFAFVNFEFLPCAHCEFEKVFGCPRTRGHVCRPQLACESLRIWLSSRAEPLPEPPADEDKN